VITAVTKCLKRGFLRRLLMLFKYLIGSITWAEVDHYCRIVQLLGMLVPLFTERFNAVERRLMGFSFGFIERL